VRAEAGDILVQVVQILFLVLLLRSVAGKAVWLLTDLQQIYPVVLILEVRAAALIKILLLVAELLGKVMTVIM
jgi:hypothetical protein